MRIYESFCPSMKGATILPEPRYLARPYSDVKNSYKLLFNLKVFAMKIFYKEKGAE